MKTRLILTSMFSVLLALTACRSDFNPDIPKVVMPSRGLCAHRGALQTHPENTLTAFQQAIRAGAHMIEFDARLTRDGQVVVIHDSAVDRTTNGRGCVSNLTLAQIKKLDAGSWKSPDFAGETIPTLKETLDIMPCNIWLNIHIKGDKNTALKAARIIAQTNRTHQAFLACKKDAAQAARKLVPDILICSMDRSPNVADYVNIAVRNNADFIQLRSPFQPSYPACIKKLKQNNIKINYYRADSVEDLPMLFEAGIDFPLVNNITLAVKTAEKLKI